MMIIMGDVDLKEKLCRQFCAYYKPQGREELACMGFTVVGGLLKKGRSVSFEYPEKEVCATTRDLLVQALCRRCPFFEDDCDFAAKTAGAAPCGGFVLLSGLIEKGTIVVDDLKYMQ
jgi:hypothetical protein